jgi:hypothetical protein
MRALVVYESIYGNTDRLAHAIAEGLAAELDEVKVVPVEGADEETVRGADVVVVGGPTHMHGLSSERSRKMGIEAAAKDVEVQLDPDAEGPGLRDWLDQLPDTHARAAAFDTRFDGPPLMTGRASKGIARRLRHHGLEMVAEPASFLVDKQNHLQADQLDRGREWGTHLATALARRS